MGRIRSLFIIVVHALVAGHGTGQTHDRDRLVCYAVGLSIGAILGDPTSVKQAGLSGVAELGIDLFPVIILS